MSLEAWSEAGRTLSELINTLNELNNKYRQNLQAAAQLPAGSAELKAAVENLARERDAFNQQLDAYRAATQVYLNATNNLGFFDRRNSTVISLNTQLTNLVQLLAGELNATRAVSPNLQQLQERSQQPPDPASAATLPPADSASQQVNAEANNSPTSSGQQQINNEGQVVPVPTQTAPSTAVVAPTLNSGGGDRGTDAATRTLEQTQAPISSVSQGVSLPVAPGVGANDNNPPPLAASALGQQAGDDTFGGATQDEYQFLNSALGQSGTTGTVNTLGENLRITPKPNVLDRFSSYTYRASWYIITPEQYRQMTLSQKKSVNGYMLLMQSGGAPINSGGPQGAKSPSTQTFFENNGASSTNASIPNARDADAGRNPYFPDDFYFENINIENLITGNGSRAAHAVTNIKFTVVEPSNITLLDRLYEAVQDFMPASGQKQNINYASVIYLMVIRFYGYDENGNLVTNIGATDQSGRSDPNAVIEKFIPFKIAKCDWTVENKLVSYNIEGLAVGQITAAGTKRGTIPYDVQLTAKSLGELLGGDVQFANGTAPSAAPGTSTTASRPGPDAGAGNNAVVFAENAGTVSNSVAPAPPNANAAATPKRTLTQGLMGAMNQYQQELVKNGIQEYADTYNIVFATGGAGGGGQAIEKAKLIPPGTIPDRKNAPTAPPPTSDASSADMSRVFVDITSRNYSITAGMQLVQAIDLAIRNSEFIYAQQTKFYNNDNDQNSPEEQTKPGTGRDVVWYNLTFQALPKSGQYDRKRNDFAYDITFIVNTWIPMNFSSNYFPINRFRGLHKVYPYWFTGQNTSVLEYKETLNNLYNLTISGSATDRNLLQRQNMTSSMRDQPFYSYQSASAESRQGVSGKENEPGSNLAENLYDPVGLANCKLKIVGDPSWIQQGSIAFGINPNSFNGDPFLQDGTINFDARQIMFEVAWQRPQDYDINTGLADPYSKSSRREPIQSRVYTASKVTSMFERGTFTQLVEGLLYFFMKPNANNKAVSAPMPTTGRQVDLNNTLRPNERAPKSGTISVPLVTSAPGSATSGVFNAAPPGPKDQVAPAEVQPPQSNGDLTPGTIPGGEEAGLGFVAPQPVARNGEVNANTLLANTPGAEQTTFSISFENQQPFFRSTRRDLIDQSTTNPPQDIAWEP
jgi:hypothetical protein